VTVVSVAERRCTTGSYQVPFTFTGDSIKLVLSIEWPKLATEDEKRLLQAPRNHGAGE
jgi:hypothetical protein